jgi:hypothetical protein
MTQLSRPWYRQRLQTCCTRLILVCILYFVLLLAYKDNWQFSWFPYFWWLEWRTCWTNFSWSWRLSYINVTWIVYFCSFLGNPSIKKPCFVKCYSTNPFFQMRMSRIISCNISWEQAVDRSQVSHLHQCLPSRSNTKSLSRRTSCPSRQRRWIGLLCRILVQVIAIFIFGIQTKKICLSRWECSKRQVPCREPAWEVVVGYGPDDENRLWLYSYWNTVQ